MSTPAAEKALGTLAAAGDVEQVQVVVVFDVVNWAYPLPGTIPLKHAHSTALRGATVTMPKTEADRLGAFGAVVAADDPEEVEEAQEAFDAAKGPVPAGQAGDEYLMSLGVAELAAYVGQHESEQDRVVALESARAKPRQGVLKAAGAA